MKAEFDVAVIGGGLAGMCAAVALAREGKKVGVFEAGPRLGGRAQSWTDPASGDTVDLGPHILLSTYPNMRKLLGWLGTEDLVQWQDQAMIDQVRGTEITKLRFAPLPPPFHFLPSLMVDHKIPFIELTKMAPLMAHAISADEERLALHDSQNALELLRGYGVSEALIDSMWRFVGLAILNLPLEECSGTAFLRFLRFMAARKDYRVGFARVGLGDLFAEPGTAAVERAGGRVRLGCKVETLEANGSRVTGARLSDGSTVQARHWVIATSPGDIRSFLPAGVGADGLREVSARFEPCPYLCIYLWFDRPISDRAFWARAYREEDLNCDFYDLSRFRKGWEGRPSVIASNIIYSERAGRLTDAEIVEKTIEELSEFIPAVRQAKLVRSLVNRVPMAIHCPRPGTENLRPPTRASLSGLYVAGDWVKTGFPSSMESACRAGFLAADAILQEEAGGNPRPTPTAEGLGDIGAFTRINASFWNSIFSRFR